MTIYMTYGNYHTNGIGIAGEGGKEPIMSVNASKEGLFGKWVSRRSRPSFIVLVYWTVDFNKVLSLGKE